ncbi:aspartyl protease family protein [Phenylobacterium sp.]|uniref:aspartyl protease family protein n=1 Tax=Phenylobacterium sp. TaxID=1871053 RepID=UPI00121B76A0|nr:aspartyl protease family protein [Phenylobacterium sp.]THD56437.1 MAG: tetratricopeptide repeat protein [Phenylobacterium sp.]
MLTKGFVTGAALAGVVFAAASAAQAECKFQKIAEVPVTMEGLRPFVSVKINGHDTKMVLDSGAFFSNVSDEAAQQFNMHSTPAPFGMEVRGVGGGSESARAVKADDFLFANAMFHNIEFLAGGRVGAPGVSGLMGENILGPFDVEYDLANGIIRFFRGEGCGDANLAYWSQGKAMSRTRIDQPGRFIQQINTTATVDGHFVRVTLDTGAPVSMLSRPAAARVGIQVTTEGVSAAGTTHGIAGRSIEVFLAPFASFKIGDEEIKNTKLRVTDLRMGDSDMLLGMDFFLSHRVLVSNSQKRLYFTYNGGPVFRLDDTSGAQLAKADAAAAASVAANAPPADAAGAEAPKTAPDFARRASAFAARREYERAVADYSQAITLEPDNGPYYRARAMARLGARQPVLAMADLDEALKRQPNDPEALMRRGELYLQARDAQRGKADFEQAIKLAPENADLPAQAGFAYSRAGLFQPAIEQLDAWVATHPKSDDLPTVLAARCYTRGAWGKELDVALADCDVAIRKDKTSGVMQSRGLVLLRQGRLDEAIAQYSAALKAQPRLAMALYGRGVAELKKGDKAAGDADIAAAVAIAPALPAEFKRFGMAPEADAKAAGA